MTNWIAENWALIGLVIASVWLIYDYGYTKGKLAAYQEDDYPFTFPKGEDINQYIL